MEEQIFLFVAGLFAGVVSGLLGIGGGVILVPALYFFFQYFSYPESIIMHMVIATSLASMVLTSFSSAVLHIKSHNVQKNILLATSMGIIVGGTVGANLAHFIPHKVLAILFCLFLFGVGIRFFWNVSLAFIKAKQCYVFPGGICIGFFSAILGIGGGVIALPFFSSLSMPFIRAIGTAAYTTFLSATIGSISYALVGYFHHIYMARSVGYVYIPAVVIVGISMLFTTRIGVVLSKKLPCRVLEKFFAILVFFTAISMLYHIF